MRFRAAAVRRGVVAVLVLSSLATRAGASSEPQLDAAAHAELQHLIMTRGFTRGLPSNPMPSPDGQRVYFLRSGPTDRIQVLYVFDVATAQTRRFLAVDDLGGAQGFSKEEQARRERQRLTERGITSFQLSRDGRQLVVPNAGDLYLVDAQTSKLRRLTQTPQPELDAHLSPDGRHIAFVRGSDLVKLDLASAEERVIAHSTEPGVSYGTAEFVAQEEMDRSTGHWWSPDSRRLALTEVDTRGVPRFRVPDFSDATGEGDAAAYPKPGDPNASVRLGVTIPPGDSVQWLDLGADVEYLARVDWSPDGSALWVQTQPRSQKRIDLRRIDLASGRVRVVHRDTDRDFVNLHDDFRPLGGKGERFLWSSERTGHRHLEVGSADGRAPRAITSGAWDVERVVDVDEEHGEILFTGTKDGVLEQQLYRVPLRGGRVERVSTEPGWHDAAFHKYGHALYVESFSDDRTPTRQRVRWRNGKIAGELPSAAETPPPAEYEPVGQFLRLTSPDGTPLDVRLVMPPMRDGSTARVPLVVYVYAGPGAQQVRRSWPAERGLLDAWLARRGFAVARIDGRGVHGRGHASEHIFSSRLGQRELQDQVAGVHALLARTPQLDPARVGIWGWSYGGYMTLMAMMRAPDVFRAGVSVAPVVDWLDYDTHYTERYLGLPSANAAGYDSSGVLPWVPGLRGHLTLVHGTTDDNVHFRESMRLVQEMVARGKRFDLMVYPGTHQMESLEERTHLYELVWRTFATHL